MPIDPVSVGVSVGKSLVGGFLSGRQAEKDMENAKEMARYNLGMQKRAAREMPRHVRIGAERAGFNPLTVLGAGGLGAGAGLAASAPPLASQGYLLNMIDEVGMEITGEAALMRERAKLENALVGRQLEAAAELSRYGALSSYATGGAARGGAAPGATGNPPGQNPTSADDDPFQNPINVLVPHRLPDGRIVMGLNPDLGDSEQAAVAAAMIASPEVPTPGVPDVGEFEGRYYPKFILSPVDTHEVVYPTELDPETGDVDDSKKYLQVRWGNSPFGGAGHVRYEIPSLLHPFLE